MNLLQILKMKTKKKKYGKSNCQGKLVKKNDNRETKKKLLLHT
jgi:hypothetical protein